MIVGELRHGQLAILDRIRETVRLAEGLSESGDISPDARQRAIDCLSRFGERLRDMKAGSVRAAGTSTIRRAREDSTFMAEAETVLGHPIEIISGIEEARLIYNGVAHSLPPTDGLRLVMDIGGGSTELILGQATHPKAISSICFSWLPVDITAPDAASLPWQKVQFVGATPTSQVGSILGAPPLPSLWQ